MLQLLNHCNSMPYPPNLNTLEVRVGSSQLEVPPQNEEEGSDVEPPDSAVTASTGLGERCSSKEGALLSSGISGIPPLFFLMARRFRGFLHLASTRLLGHSPRLHKFSHVFVALKKGWLNMDPKHLKLLAFALLLLLVLRFRRVLQYCRTLSVRRASSQRGTAKVNRPSDLPSNDIASQLRWTGARRRLTGAPEISFSEVLELVAADAVEEVHYSPGSRLRLTLKDKRQVASTLVPGADASFFRTVAARVPTFRFERKTSLSEAVSVVFPLVLLCLWWRMLRSLIEPLRGGRETATDRGLEVFPPHTAFSDVICEQKHELLEIVLLLNGDGRYNAMGARLPRGLLLVGPSGTGKTLLARAVAGEARVPFLSVAASEFVEVFVGQGARRVREVFQAARRRAPCVLFIDEIDALGCRAGSFGAVSGHEEYVQTVNQFLMEMDGVCGGNDGVVVIGATNRLKAIDPALLRSGRFDRHIHLQLPSAQERLEILKLHVANKRMNLLNDAWAHLQRVAEAGEGLSGADLENLLNESVFRAIRRGRESVDPQALDEALLALFQRAEKQHSLDN